MSFILNTLLNAVAATGAGTPVDFTAEPKYQGGQHTLEVSGTFTGTVAFEGLIDVTWYPLWSTTAPAMQTVAGTFKQIRGNVTAYTSGNITLKANCPLLQDLATDITTLLGRLTAARAGYLDQLAAAALPTDIATLLARLTATRAANLDNVASNTNVIGVQKQIRKNGGVA